MADGSRIYLGRMPHRAKERDIERFFKGYGKISDIILKNGFAFVDFEEAKDAEDAAYDLGGKEMMGERVIVEIARGTPHGRDRFLDEQKRRSTGSSGRRSDRRSRSRSRSRGRDNRDKDRGKSGPGYKLIIENLSSRVTKEDLKDLFRKYADLTYVDANGKRKNEGMVEVETKSELNKLIEKYDGYELSGRKIKLVPDKKKSRSRSRSPPVKRSRTRSKSNSPAKSDAEENGKKRAKSGSASPRPRSKFQTKSESRSRSRSASASADEAANGHKSGSED